MMIIHDARDKRMLKENVIINQIDSNQEIIMINKEMTIIEDLITRKTKLDLESREDLDLQGLIDTETKSIDREIATKAMEDILQDQFM